jgi:hypothetical protein
MSPRLNPSINETLRDAMLDFYLTQVTPKDASLAHLKTPDDLYQHWLLDVQVSQDVPSGEVACAIASLQHYINRIQLGLEPGYENGGMDASQKDVWRDRLQSYPSWSGSEKLRTYPENYLNPLLRKHKSQNFQQLENDLNQYRIQTDTVQTAVQNYLSRFEEIANIRTLNGYIDANHTELSTGTYYFIGKSSSENTYYWRSLKLARPLNTSTATPAITEPPLMSFMDWSDWKKIDLVLPSDAMDHTLRPVVFNNRLFLVWAECAPPNESFKSNRANSNGADEGGEDLKKSRYARISVKYAFKKYDDSWSAAQTCIEEYGFHFDTQTLPVEDLQKLLQTVAVFNSDPGSDSLFIGIQFNFKPSYFYHLIPLGFRSDFLQAVSLDHHHTVQVLANVGAPEREIQTSDNPLPETRFKATSLKTANEEQIFAKYSVTNSGRFQFVHSTSDIVELRPKTITFDPPRWNASGRQQDIEPLEIALNSTTNQLIITSRLKKRFPSSETFILRGGEQNEGWEIRLTPLAPSPENGMTESLPVQFKVTLKTDTEQHEQIRLANHILIIKNLRTGKVFKTLFSPDRKTIGYRFEKTEIGFEETIISLDVYHFFSNHRNDSFRVTFESDNEHEHSSEPFKRQGLSTLQTETQQFYRHVIMAPSVACETPPVDLNDFTMDILGEDASLQFNDAEVTSYLEAAHTLSIPVARNEHKETKTRFFAHGVLIYKRNEHGKYVIEGALHYVSVDVDYFPSSKYARAPGISRTASAGYGTAEYLDFEGSAVHAQPIRMNTSFARRLVQVANLGLEELFLLKLKSWQEPPLTQYDTQTSLDFHGAHGKYFWELFVYLPWSVAYRLNQEQQYQQAEAWLGYVFNPGETPYWQLEELMSQRNANDYALLEPYDPNQLALSFPKHLRKALYMLYLDILINRGDAAYRQLTPDSLAEAKLWYVRANQLLGPRPAVTLIEPWESISLADLADRPSWALRQLEQSMPLLNPRAVETSNPTPWLSDTDHLLVPLNSQLIARWDKLESRLHNLRHNLDIAGSPLRLPLYTASIAPGATQAPYGQENAAVARAVPATHRKVGHFRFQAVFGHAMNAVETVIQFGNTLLSLVERKEQAEHLQLQQQQAWDLAEIIVSQQSQALVVDQKNRQALQASRNIIEARALFFQHQLEAGLSAAELEAAELYRQSAAKEDIAAVAGVASGVAMLIPNIYGTSFGGVRLEGVPFALQAAAQGEADRLRNDGSLLDRSAQFARRAEEWTHAKEQADLELTQVDAQLKVYQEQEKATRLQLQVARTALAHARTTFQQLSKRFTSAELYHWLNGLLADFYHEAYDLALSLCRDAEACWRYELADYDRFFIQTNAWNNQHQGFLMGESLKLDLMKMNAAYLQGHQRDLEIVKTLSLRQKMKECLAAYSELPFDDQRLDLWTEFMKKVIAEEHFQFSLPEHLFDEDYRDHDLRRVKAISVSLHATIGPYQDIKAILTQLKSEVRLPGARKLTTDWRATQQVALSTGFDDNGQFTLDFGNDNRYLPFEYTGAVSQWRLAFSNPINQTALLHSVTDIIIHLRYTARPRTGGGQ